jgi:hypothetical protein
MLSTYSFKRTTVLVGTMIFAGLAVAQAVRQPAAPGPEVTESVAGPSRGFLAVHGGETSPTSPKQFIACPVKETRTEVTTTLPQPWWNTPQLGRLERVSVQTIAGNQTLVCEYRAYGRTVGIMRLFPEGATVCSAADNGFQCR